MLDFVKRCSHLMIFSFVYFHFSGTGLFRDQNQVFTKVFDVAATNLLKVGETTHWGGGALEYMVCMVWFALCML